MERALIDERRFRRGRNRKICVQDLRSHRLDGDPVVASGSERAPPHGAPGHATVPPRRPSSLSRLSETAGPGLDTPEQRARIVGRSS